MERRAGVNASYEAEEGMAIPKFVEESLFRVAQEALNNALKHSGATALKIKLSKHGVDSFSLVIEDNGSGFDLNSAASMSGMGLRNMEGRVSELGGRLAVSHWRRPRHENRGGCARQRDGRAEEAVQMIQILIADDHPVVRQGLKALIGVQSGMEVIGEAVDGQDAVAKARLLAPDVILLDLVMPLKDGVEAITEIKRENPQARILVLTSFGDDEKIFAAIEAGALGFPPEGNAA